ncbi:MAG TPA: hypothetical protein VL992_09540, partial [Tepidisphaeraceae bacterium]|nr:hypothetical protein [Tepidisphaeraceae bacterium]
ISLIQSYLASGYSGGEWNGAGIVSSSVVSANAQGSLLYTIGYADGADGVVGGLVSGEIEIMPTLAGDATLSGTVSFGDFQRLAEYYGKPGTWDEGNFTYGGDVDFGDFQVLAANYGKTSSLSTEGADPAVAQPAAAVANRAVTAANPNVFATEASGGSNSLLLAATQQVGDILDGTLTAAGAQWALGE